LPFTFNVKKKKLKAKKIVSTMPKSPWNKLEHFFANGFLLSMSKVGGQEQKKLLSTRLKTPSMKLET
jgi:hypothetical protein